jgi:DNA polymerase-1
MTQRTILLDGDVYCYQAAAAVERTVNWGEGEDDDSCLYTLHADLDDAILTLDASVETLRDALGGDRIILALTDKVNWRASVLPTYKGNRKAVRRPLVLADLRQYARDTYEVWERPGLEGDDILGILATNNAAIPGEKVVVTIDKDLHTIPGFHYNSSKPGQGIYEVTKEEADRFHILQGIAGDVTDGYTGCPGIGMAKAEEWLSEPYTLIPEEYTITRGKNKGELGTKWVKAPECASMWEGIVSLYAKAGYNEEYALQQFRVARILRSTDYDFKNKEPILWEPSLLPD